MHGSGPGARDGAGGFRSALYARNSHANSGLSKDRDSCVGGVPDPGGGTRMENARASQPGGTPGPGTARRGPLAADPAPAHGGGPPGTAVGARQDRKSTR